jgi:hypothetical protein
MQAVSEWFSGLSAGDPALWVALIAGLAVVVALLIVSRRGGRKQSDAVQLPAGSTDWDNPVPTARHDERRRSIRRGGLPTPILVVDAKGGRKAKATEAYVLDRSTGGLRLALDRPVQVGSSMLTRPGNAPEGFEWVRVTIRNCREVGDYYEVGCQFETELELSRLLLFG